MSYIFTKYKLQIVKEESHRYEVNNKISCPEDMVKVLTSILQIQNEPEEVVILITLNTKNKVTGLFEVSRGNINSSMFNGREIFKRAILNNASSIILAHNHPSGDCEPSKQDINATKNIKEAGELLGIELLDHIIVGDDNYISLKNKRII